MKYLSLPQLHNSVKTLFSRQKGRYIFKRHNKWLYSRCYADKFDAQWYVAYENNRAHYNPVSSLGKIPVSFGRMVVNKFPELGVLQLNEGRVLCPQGWIFSKEDYLLPEHSWFGRHVSEMKVPSRLPEETYIKGNVLSLLSDWAETNYGHFLLESLTRYHLFQKAGFSINDVDYILCAGTDDCRRRIFIERLGIPLDKCMWVCKDKLVTAKNLFVTSYPGIRRNYQPWVPRYLRKAFRVNSESSNRKLYVTRHNCTRKVANEEEIVPLLQSYGYEIYNPAEQRDSVFDFGNAGAVIGPHGAALADIVFCPSGARILELVPSDHIYPYYYTLAESAELKYACIVGRSLTNRRTIRGPSQYDFTINIDELKRAMDDFLE